MDKFDRAVRRHHYARVKKARVGHYGYFWADLHLDPKRMGRLARTAAPCVDVDGTPFNDARRSQAAQDQDGPVRPVRPRWRREAYGPWIPAYMGVRRYVAEGGYEVRHPPEEDAFYGRLHRQGFNP